MPWFAIAVAVASAATSIHQGFAAKAAAEAEAQQAEANINAANAAAAFDSLERVKSWKQMLGSQAALFAARGVPAFTGSALNIRKEEGRRARSDLSRIELNRLLKRGSLRTQARMLRFEGRQARLGGILSGVASTARAGVKYQAGVDAAEAAERARGGPTTD
jgi:uncharacterized hydantoinase/oxoprolinase family protein